MQVHVGCEFEYDCPHPMATVWQVRPRPDGPHRVVTEGWEKQPAIPATSYRDGFGNVCDRMSLPEGAARIRYDAVAEVPPTFDEADKDAAWVPVEDLPPEALVFLLPSRFCLPDLLRDIAWELFGTTAPGWPQVQAVCDWVHEHIRFGYGSSTALTTAVDVYNERTGVCRDYTHLAVSFCRALNVPARYVCGYLPDIAVTPPDLPMDFCAWLEAYLEGRWWTFDPRINVPRTGRVVIGRGRDATDVAMVTAYGQPTLRNMTVWADEVPQDDTRPPG
jgi:transglutaminase-like putative cysteine protease